MTLQGEFVQSLEHEATRPKIALSGIDAERVQIAADLIGVDEFERLVCFTQNRVGETGLPRAVRPGEDDRRRHRRAYSAGT